MADNNSEGGWNPEQPMRARGTGSSGQLGGTGNDMVADQPNQGWQNGQGSSQNQDEMKDKNPNFKQGQTSVTDDMRGNNSTA
jgi:hypothetical protein